MLFYSKEESRWNLFKCSGGYVFNPASKCFHCMDILPSFRMRRPVQFSTVIIVIPNILHIVFMHLLPFNFWVTLITHMAIMVLIACYYSMEHLSKTLLFTLVFLVVLLLSESCYSILMGRLTGLTLIELAPLGRCRLPLPKLVF